MKQLAQRNRGNTSSEVEVDGNGVLFPARSSQDATSRLSEEAKSGSSEESNSGDSSIPSSTESDQESRSAGDAASPCKLCEEEEMERVAAEEAKGAFKKDTKRGGILRKLFRRKA